MGNGDQSTAVQAPGIRTVEYNGRTFELEPGNHGEWLVWTKTPQRDLDQVGTIEPSGECVGYGMDVVVRDRDVFEIAQRAIPPLGIEGLYPASQLATHRKRGEA